jgi:hypothetical protein
MRRLGRSIVHVGFWLVLSVLALCSGRGQTATPDFKEVYELIRAHLPDINETELNRTAVDGLVAALAPRVSLTADDFSSTNPPVALISKSALFESGIAYLRVNRVAEGLAGSVSEAYANLATNKLKGVVLDLRYASGQDYAAAADVAGLFVKRGQPLMDWGKGLVRSKEGDKITLPLTVLINAKTAGAPEALAAALRQAGAALILGNKTAGLAMLAQEYPLKEGGRLRIASGPIQLGDGSALSAQGVKPDILVDISPEEEQLYFADAFREIPPASRLAGLRSGVAAETTNRNRRARLNEAELVRERRDGTLLDLEPGASRDSPAEKPVVRDPVLARALDVLKGLAVIRQSRS